MRLIEANWSDENARAAEELEELENKLLDFIESEGIQRNHDEQMGSLKTYFNETMPEKIESVVVKASKTAAKEIKSYLWDLQENYHWATLKASVMRGGSFSGKARIYGKNINLPVDLSSKFETEIASVWGVNLLRGIRDRIKKSTEETVKSLKQILEWAKENGAGVNSKSLETQIKVVENEAKNLNSIGSEKIAELRKEVKNNLLLTIQPPIKAKCMDFVRRGEAEGEGGQGTYHTSL